MKINMKNWITQGLFFGGFMFLFMTVFELVFMSDTFSSRKVLIGLPVWILAGLLYGYILKVTNSLPKS